MPIVERLLQLGTYLVPRQKLYTSITSIFGHIHDVLNVDKKNQFSHIVYKLRDESFEHN